MHVDPPPAAVAFGDPGDFQVAIHDLDQAIRYFEQRSVGWQGQRHRLSIAFSLVLQDKQPLLKVSG
ncbi:MAG TPA: hypothetical protein PKY77_01315 [Phycisphaerae bacterium]|nr:hypothetical protein [Phycisphaerae bacterium]HRY67505.1 hypothetical protein [Phycisphaerae bacterium]HSA24892.1 hypothetical protein [Phycisphaerae bacterium]